MLYNKKRKLIDLPEQVVKTLTIEAIKQNTVFKHYVEQLLEDKAKELDKPRDRDSRRREAKPDSSGL